MREQRILYFNDARHYYLFVFEPPMRLEDAHVPIDEVAGTAVDTFVYGVERGDGLFYPSKVGLQFGADIQPFQQAAYWRTWHNMQSLAERGLDPLQVLVDRAHERGLDFFASLRMASYGGMDPAQRVEKGGGGLALRQVRAHQFAVLEELVTDYEVEGVELDFALPGGGPRLLRPEDVETTTPVLTEYVAEIAEMVRARPGELRVGARVLPTEQMNRAQGLDVRAWLERGLVDFVVPLRYGYMVLDPDLPFDWLVEAAHAADAAVYGMLQPYVRSRLTGAVQEEWPTPAQLRAAAANYRAKGADGLYAWFMRWPLGDAERRMLSELSDPQRAGEQDRHYVLARNVQEGENYYRRHLPVDIAADDVGTAHAIPFFLADDFARGRIRQVLLRVRITDLVSADRLDFRLNGASLEGEVCARDFGEVMAPYNSMWLEFDLRGVRPQRGENVLEVVLLGRPADLVRGLRVEEVEVVVKYHPYAAGAGQGG